MSDEYGDILRQMKELDSKLTALRSARVQCAVDAFVEAVACSEDAAGCVEVICAGLKDRGIDIRRPAAMQVKKGFIHPDHPELVYKGGKHPKWLMELGAESVEAA